MPESLFAQKLERAKEKGIQEATEIRKLCEQDGWKQRGDLAALSMKHLDMQKAQAQVEKLSKFPGNLFASKEDKIKAMQNLMLKQVELHSYANQLHKLEQSSPSPNEPAQPLKRNSLQDQAWISQKKSLLTAVGSSEYNTALIKDKSTLSNLFSATELQSSNVKELSTIVNETSIEAYTKNPSANAEVLFEQNKEITKASKEASGFQRFFRSKAQNAAAQKRYDEARAVEEQLTNPKTSSSQPTSTSLDTIWDLNRKMEEAQQNVVHAQQNLDLKQHAVNAAIKGVPPKELPKAMKKAKEIVKERDQAQRELDAAQAALDAAQAAAQKASQQYKTSPLPSAPPPTPITHARVLHDNQAATQRHEAAAQAAAPSPPDTTVASKPKFRQ